jgi:hypothetical protein
MDINSIIKEELENLEQNKDFTVAKRTEINKQKKYFVKSGGKFVPVTIKSLPDPQNDFETVVKMLDGKEDVYLPSQLYLKK